MIRSILFLVLMFSAVTVLSAADSEPLRIATFNIRGPKNKPPNDQESRKPRIRKVVILRIIIR